MVLFLYGLYYFCLEVSQLRSMGFRSYFMSFWNFMDIASYLANLIICPCYIFRVGLGPGGFTPVRLSLARTASPHPSPRLACCCCCPVLVGVRVWRHACWGWVWQRRPHAYHSRSQPEAEYRERMTPWHAGIPRHCERGQQHKRFEGMNNNTKKVYNPATL